MKIFSSIDRFFTRNALRKLIILATKHIYAENFNFNYDILVASLSHGKRGAALLRVLVAIEYAAKLTSPMTEDDLDEALRHLSACEVILGTPDAQRLLDAQSEIASFHLILRQTAILKGELANMTNRHSYAGTIYRRERDGLGPMSLEAKNKFVEPCASVLKLNRELEEQRLAVMRDAGEPNYFVAQQEYDNKLLQEIIDESDETVLLDEANESLSELRGELTNIIAQSYHDRALMYQEGKEVTQDYTEASRLYTIAAKLGHAGSQNNLGALYEGGEGVAEDHAIAIAWYQKAANSGDLFARNNFLRLSRYLEHKKHQATMLSCLDLLLPTVPPLIGNCNLLPYPKKEILYAIQFLKAAVEQKRESADDASLIEEYDDRLNDYNLLTTVLARDWHIIDAEDLEAVGKLAGLTAFPEWALPLKVKYINDDLACQEAFQQCFQVANDNIEYEKALNEC